MRCLIIIFGERRKWYRQMIEFIKYIEDAGRKYSIVDPEYKINVTRFLVANDWFGMKPELHGSEIYITKEELETVHSRIEEFCSMYNSSVEEKIECLLGKMTRIFPKTEKMLRKYAKDSSLENDALYYLADFLLFFMAGDLIESTDQEIAYLMDDGYDNLSKIYGDILADFVNWTHAHTKTIYQKVYFMNKHSSNENKTQAYDPDDYLEILYHLFNSDYISDNEMYTKAAESKNYVDTWLFLSLHFLCALRNTDIIRIPHPRLIDSPKKTLELIAKGVFSEKSARQILYSVVWHLEAIMLTPNKTKKYSGIPSIKIHIPASIEVHIGTLFAAAEAHFQLSGLRKDEPLIRIISSYEQINRYMGEDIGELFLAENFHSRAANKAYMQMIFLLTDDILDVNDEFNVKGYMLAALARSHKGSYGSFARTTSIYLRDAKMNGYSPEFVAKELFERGVLSCIPSMLLKMIDGDTYNKLTVEKQTQAIRTLNMSPMEVERAVAIMQVNMKKSVSVVNNIYSNFQRQQILEILHKIGNGEAVAKSSGCMCLMTAMGKLCPFNDISNCPSCEYEISTKTTMFLMAQEWYRLKKLYEKSTSEIEKNRYKSLALNIVIPSIEEMLQEIEHQYGERAADIMEAIIAEVAN